MRITSAIILAALFLMGILTSGDWPSGARIYLLVVAAPGLVLVLVELLSIIRAQKARLPAPAATADTKSPARFSLAVQGYGPEYATPGRDYPMAVGQPPGADAHVETPMENGSGRSILHGVELKFLAWLLAYLIGTWLFGALISSVLFIFLYLRLVARESWFTTITTTVVAALVLWGLLDNLLNMTILGGLVWY